MALWQGKQHDPEGGGQIVKSPVYQAIHGMQPKSGSQGFGWPLRCFWGKLANRTGNPLTGYESSLCLGS
jgi:hypothetical protein